MRQRNLVQTSVNEQWAWPLTLSQYDRQRSFNSSEKRAVREYVIRRQRSSTGIPSHIHQSLQRVLQPITDALNVIGFPPDKQGAVLCVLMDEMGWRKSTFWSWSQADWVEFLGPNNADYRRRYNQHTRQSAIAVAYLLAGFSSLQSVGSFERYPLAIKVFDRQSVDTAVDRIWLQLLQIGYDSKAANEKLRIQNAVCEILLLNRSPRLENLTSEALDAMRRGAACLDLKNEIIKISRALCGFGIIAAPLQGLDKDHRRFARPATLEEVHPEWAGWCQRWLETTTITLKPRRAYYHELIGIGRWLSRNHPEIVSPEMWTRELAAEFVAAVDHMNVGDWVSPVAIIPSNKIGKPLKPRSKERYLTTIRTFFCDCQEWNWITRRFDPRRCLATPRSIHALIGPSPRVIEDSVWAKLLWAGLNLMADDIPFYVSQSTGATNSLDPRLADKRIYYYPFEMVRAMTLVWLFCALRSDEIIRLRVGCIRMQCEDLGTDNPGDKAPENKICWLDVPTNKTCPAFTKPVDILVGEAITDWQKLRPEQPAMLDPKTGEMVHYLFCYRGKRVGMGYLNEAVIPMLCRKAGVPAQDARGPLTSHRARSTIATQLHSAKEGMSLFELMQWLGHRYAESTMNYLKASPTKLAKAFSDADYFKRNLRSIEVLIDQEVIRSGAAVAGAAWKFYDLGHGYCTYDFFDQCPHRMVCAKCDFYLPKESGRAQILEAKGNLQRMIQEIPLREEERAAVEDGLAALERLETKLVDVPTPTGPTPREIRSKVGRELPVLRHN
jgi:integrase